MFIDWDALTNPNGNSTQSRVGNVTPVKTSSCPSTSFFHLYCRLLPVARTVKAALPPAEAVTDVTIFVMLNAGCVPSPVPVPVAAMAASSMKLQLLVLVKPPVSVRRPRLFDCWATSITQDEPLLAAIENRSLAPVATTVLPSVPTWYALSNCDDVVKSAQSGVLTTSSAAVPDDVTISFRTAALYAWPVSADR